MFKKLAAVEPVSLIPSAEEELHQRVGGIMLHEDVPSGDGEIVRRIGDADAALINYISRISRRVIESCLPIRCTGMRCSLYPEESANVDIACARERGITVLGIRDYGDRRVAKYVLSELVRLPHGFDRPMFRDMPVEITGLKMGIIGVGVSGGMIADALKFMGADVSYHSHSRKQDREGQRITYRLLGELPDYSEAISACLNKSVILLREKEFRQLG